MQRRQDRANSQSRSEFFSKYKEYAASGFPIEQPTISNGLKYATKDVEHPPPMRKSYSGPLVAGAGWKQSGKKYSEISVSSRGGLYMHSGLVASSEVGLTKDQVGKLSESSEEFMHTRKHDQRDDPQSMADPRHIENGRAKEPIMDGQGYKGNKIHFSGPLVSSNVDQMLKDHDRHIQEAARRARLEKTKLSNLEAEGALMTTNAVYPSSRLAM